MTQILQPGKEKAGIYLHIPFCKRACHYCNFHFSTSLALKNEFIDALLKEIHLQQQFLPGTPIDSIYFGGGTPSLLTIPELNTILDSLHRHFSILPAAEITLEANPDDITIDKVLRWRASGINRLSIGIQSFFEADLKWMNRAHNSVQAIKCIEDTRKAGIENFTIDLIYGGPTLTDENWESNVRKAITLEIPHLSCYALTVEPKTALDKLIEKKVLSGIDTEDQARQFLLLTQWLTESGYEHYEISNFSLPGMRSRHNSSYWNGVSYLGLGPSAHSFRGNTRRWNVANNALYIKSLKEGIIPFESEELTEVQQYNEYIMTALRTSEGIDLNRLNMNQRNNLLIDVQKYIETGKVLVEGDHIKLTIQGKLFADGIAADLFSSEL